MDGCAAAHHLLVAHGLAVKEIRHLAADMQRYLTLGMSLNFTSIQPTQANNDNDIELAHLLDMRLHRFFIEPFMCGNYPVDLLLHFGACGIERRIQDGALALICMPIDTLGVNYYRGYNVKVKGKNQPLYCDMSKQHEVVKRDCEPSTMVWEVCPNDCEDMLAHLHNNSLKKAEIPIVITKNGAAFDDYPDTNDFVDDRTTRLAYIRDHLVVVSNALAKGVDIRR